MNYRIQIKSKNIQLDVDVRMVMLNKADKASIERILSSLLEGKQIESFKITTELEYHSVTYVEFLELLVEPGL